MGGAAIAFAIHVVIAVSIGVALFNILPHRAVDALVAVLFVAGAVYAFLIRNQVEEEHGEVERGLAASHHGHGLLCHLRRRVGRPHPGPDGQLGPRYHSPWASAWPLYWRCGRWPRWPSSSGQGLLRLVPIKKARIATAAVLLASGRVTAVQAIRG